MHFELADETFHVATRIRCSPGWVGRNAKPYKVGPPRIDAGRVGDTLSLAVCWTRTGRSPCRTGNHFLSAKENGTRSILIRGSVARVFVEEEEEDGTFNSRRD
ncbi:uncharacterized protein LOC119765173 [Culex quinquefasciatus]|uniref:uncharacterized protein LOC119765173 n=1 Tax=Culex quinquefasciatus TaxID=7176 RepID=UPI0018E31FC8|nr:uncharacterized protein LOC119765173 [Culex quinquefasciatus]